MRKMNLASREVLLRAQQRGYDPESIRGCILEDRGDRWIVDVDHPAYPRDRGQPIPQPAPKQQPTTSGPGTELKKLLKKVGIVAAPGCSCNKRARIMDEKGCDWCRENVEMIVDWLGEEASKRKLPFFRAVGKMLVNRAIRNADTRK